MNISNQTGDDKHFGIIKGLSFEPGYFFERWRESRREEQEQQTSQERDVVEGQRRGSARGRRGRGRGRTRGRISPEGRRVANQQRARGRGRGQRGGRGRHGRQDQRSAEEAENLQEDRVQRVQTLVNDMALEQLRDICIRMVQAHPGLIFNLLEETRIPNQGYHPPEGAESPAWCTCNKCREMPTDAEKLCCEMLPENCISQLPDMNLLVLDPAVLALARAYRNEIFVLENEEDQKRANRHAAYRQFVLWRHGKLGAGNRVVIPSCCVWKIRDSYPNAFGQYKGFIPARLV